MDITKVAIMTKQENKKFGCQLRNLNQQQHDMLSHVSFDNNFFDKQYVFKLLYIVLQQVHGKFK